AIVQGTIGGAGRKAPVPGGAIEIYERGRFFTVTGRGLLSQPHEVAACEVGLDAVHARYFKRGAQGDDELPRAGRATSPPLTDGEVLERAFAAKNGERVRRLYEEGDWKAAGFPSQSEADAALGFHLYFWTQEREQFERLLKASALYREKFDRPDYL